MRAGSSPLARGLHQAPVDEHRGPGIIPARAGFTRRSGSCPPLPTDHPRSRGVYPRTETPVWSAEGSSPLARGLRLDARPDPVPGGIIPARAGFTPTGRRIPTDDEDHPRSRGVYADSASSDTGHSWIIPARAGFTTSFAGLAAFDRDHPRSRGVYRDMITEADLPDGSSPLARGLPPGSQRGPGESGIIPARAGFTGAPSCTGGVHRDHPRSRGVYRSSGRSPPSRSGSSPLARGLRPLQLPGGGQGRIIPARAGFTRYPYKPPSS